MALPILDFLIKRMEEYDPTFEHRPGTAFSDLFMQPLAMITQPIRDEINEIYISQSLKRIQDLDDPDLYPEQWVDELVANLYVFRRQGAKAAGSVRVYFTEPKELNYISETLEFTNSNSQKYYNISPVIITKQEMNNNTELEFYYVDVPIQALEEGESYEVAEGGIIASSEPDAIRVFNTYPISGGLDRETNLELIARTQKSIGVRDMNTGKGFNAIMFETFLNKIVELQPIGFGDPEMMRDIIYNYHIGGRIDGWVKTPKINDGFFNAVGLNVDFTRRISATRNLPMYGTESTTFGIQNLDVTDNSVKAFNTDDLEQSAMFVSGVNLEDGIDLSANQFIGVALNDGEYKNIKIAGAKPSETVAGEISNRINVGLGQRVCSVVVNPIIISRRRTGAIPSTGVIFYDPTENIFANTFPGDRLSVTVGPNAGTYEIIGIVSNNEVQISSLTPFLYPQEEVNYRVSRVGTYIKIVSPQKNIDSRIFVGSPNTGSDALLDAMGLAPQPLPYAFRGTGRYEYTEGVDFQVDLLNGSAKRIIGSFIVADTSTGMLTNGIFFDDPTTDIFLNVEPGDMLTIIDSSTDEIEKDYRIREKVTNQRVRIDSFIPGTEVGVRYRITRTGIKDNEFVLFKFDYNPLSIDIGNKVQLDEYGRVRGIRPNREEQTITDLAFLWTTSLELIDPLTEEPSGEVLDGVGGYGQGSYGRGGYGIGSRAQYSLVVNVPEHRFSALEDSLIVIDTAFLGQSFRVNYKYVPEILEFDAFARSDSERVLDADVLIRHFIPAVVDMDIKYTVDPTNASTPDSATITQAIVDFINTSSGGSLDASDIVQLVLKLIDPTSSAKAKVTVPFKMKATVYNTDGTRTIIENNDTLSVPEEEIPSYTPRPLSPRIARWVAGNITVTVIDPGTTGTL